MTRPAACILIVDDEPQNRKLLEVLLRPEGYLTRTASHGQEALDSVAREPPDLILLDVMMPGLDGCQVASMLKADPATASIPIILVTAQVDREARLAGLQAGAEDFLSKPVDRAELWLRVRNLLRLKAYSDILQNHSNILEQHVKARTDELRTSEARFRSLVELSSDWYWEQDQEYRFTALTGRENELGWDKERIILIGQRRWELPKVAPLAESWELHKALLQAHKPFRNFEYQRVLGNGMLQYFSASGEPVFDADGSFTGYRGVGTDITERKRAEEALRASELQQRQLAVELEIERSRLVAAQRVAKVGSWETDVATMSVTWSEETHRIFETDRATFYPTLEAFFAIVHPKDRARVHEAFTQSLIARETLGSVRHRLLLADGRIKFVEECWRVCFDEQMQPVTVIGTSRDVTERVRADEEIRALNINLERRVAERTAELEAANRELEAFDYSVAHDLLAPIRHIEGFTSMLLEDYGDKLDVRGRQCLEKVQGAGKRMELLVSDLLALSLVSRCELNRSDVDLSALAQSVFANFQAAEPQRDIECVIMPCVSVNADVGLLRVVLENLIGNAWKFTAKQPRAKIEFGCASLDNVPTFFVRDNGAGFDQGYAHRLFAPFQRLHAQSEFKGTGIGLATVSRIITRNGGKVWAEGIVNCGATFHFTLPLGPAEMMDSVHIL